jgi:hypothetical protein
MKKLTLLTLASLCLLSLTSSAQITKGSVLLGGGISGYKNKSGINQDENTNSSFAFYPAFGLAIKENAVAGLRLSYFHSKAEQNGVVYPNVQEQNGFSAGVFYRRYMGLGKKFYLFGEGSVYYSYSKNRQEYTNSKSLQTNNNVGVSFYPGVAFAVSRKIHLEVGLNDLVDLSYGSNKMETTLSGTTTISNGSGFGFSTNVSTSAPLSVGFRIVLGK